jgi:NADPH2:quinone reductase
VQVLEIRSLDGPDGVVAAQRPDVVASGEEVLIEVRAAGVSFPDLLQAQGRYQHRPELPFVAGGEVAGIVRTAPAASGLQPGERVWASTDGGGFAELAVVAPHRVRRLPNHLSFEQGAALGVNFLTAVFALRGRGRLVPGETVVVLGAAGGLGTATVAVAKAYGARAIAVVSTAAKAPTATAAGADVVLVGDAWRDAVLAETGGHGADLVADVVGGDATLEAVRSAAPEGRVLVLGFTSGAISSIAVNRLLLRNVSLVGVGLGAFVAVQPSAMVETIAELMRLVDGGLRPLVGATFRLAEGADALRALGGRTALGKLVLTVG